MSYFVSKNSHKVVAFNTITLALKQRWTDKPMDDISVAKQGKYIADVWGILTAVRPEFGLLGLADRQGYRATSMAASALSFYGVLAVIDQLWTDGVSVVDAKAFIDKLAPQSSDPSGDWLSRSNPLWLKDGIIYEKTLKSGATTYPTRNNFQTRDAVADLFIDRVTS